MRRLWAASAALLLCVQSDALAQAALGGPSTTVSDVTVTARRATRVDDLTVSASRCTPAAATVDPQSKPPVVVATYPEPGSTVAPGYLALRISFDQPMSSCSFAYGPDFPLKFPALTGKPPVLLTGGKTFLLMVRVKADARYGVKLNAPPTGFFISRSGQAALPIELRFATSKAAPLTAEQAAAIGVGAGPAAASPPVLAASPPGRDVSTLNQPLQIPPPPRRRGSRAGVRVVAQPGSPPPRGRRG